jgi:hypothetical protein
MFGLPEESTTKLEISCVDNTLIGKLQYIINLGGWVIGKSDYLIETK